MKKLLFVFVLGIGSVHTFGQSKLLRGKVVADSLFGYAINIVNYTQKRGTTNDEHGYFEISGDVNDSIVFSSVQYEVFSLVVSLDDVEKEFIQINLKPIIQQLEQVAINNISLSGNLNSDV